MENRAIIYRHHDRHVEDVYEVYPYSRTNFKHLKERCKKDWPDAGEVCMENHPDCDYAYGWPDGTLYNNSYYSTLRIVPMKNI